MTLGRVSRSSGNGKAILRTCASFRSFMGIPIVLVMATQWFVRVVEEVLE